LRITRREHYDRGVDVRTTRWLKYGAAAAAMIVFAVLVLRAVLARAPYRVDAELLSGWTIAEAPPGAAAVVEAKPPTQLLDDLFRQVTSRTDHALVPADRAAVPLVLADEYSDSLQGALSVQDIVSVGQGVGLDSVRFEPVCIGERHRENGSGSEELIFAVFNAPLFDQFRYELTPLFPEAAGAGVYNPPGLRLVLAIAATSKDVDHWWPIGFNPQRDCISSLRTS
jgi:hypothetical protein